MIPVARLASDPNPLLKWSYVTGQWDDIQADLITHLQLTLTAVGLGLVISALLAAVALRFDWTVAPIAGLTGFLFTLPSVALFGVLAGCALGVRVIGLLLVIYVGFAIVGNITGSRVIDAITVYTGEFVEVFNLEEGWFGRHEHSLNTPRTKWNSTKVPVARS